MARASFLQFRLVQNFEPLLDALVQKLLSPLHSLQVPPTIRLLVFVEPCLTLKRRIALVANEQHVVVVLCQHLFESLLSCRNVLFRLRPLRESSRLRCLSLLVRGQPEHVGRRRASLEVVVVVAQRRLRLFDSSERVLLAQIGICQTPPWTKPNVLSSLF